MKKFLIIFILSLVFFFFFCSWITPCYKNGLFEIGGGEGLFQITQNLKEQGFIQTELLLNVYVLFQGKAGELKSGVYLLTSDDTFLTIAKKLINGETHTIKVTIPEGYNLAQIDASLSAAGVIEKGELIDFKPVNFHFSNLEGFLFPDTYYFYPHRNTEEIVEIFLENFNKKLTPGLREKINQQGKTIFQIVTMASLLEKEVKSYEEKRLVSGVLWKRLESNIPLQVDATIAYITGKKTTKISKEETRIDSPYNTYKHRGLPRGPICNPGIESIKAAIEPKDSEDWYYLSTPEGETIFSENLEKHNQAKRRYLQ